MKKQDNPFDQKFRNMRDEQLSLKIYSGLEAQ